MAVEWPEETEAKRAPRRVSYFAHSQGQLEVFDDDPNEPKRRFAYLVPTLVVLGILVAIGLVLAVYGPLPTVFPTCGFCEAPGV
jgi:hypothetical protein